MAQACAGKRGGERWASGGWAGADVWGGGVGLRACSCDGDGVKEQRAAVSQGEGVEDSARMRQHTRQGPSAALGRNCGLKKKRGMGMGEGFKGRLQTHLKKRKEQDGKGGA